MYNRNKRGNEEQKRTENTGVERVQKQRTMTNCVKVEMKEEHRKKGE